MNQFVKVDFGSLFLFFSTNKKIQSNASANFSACANKKTKKYSCVRGTNRFLY
ncbi:hypothetical protein KAOT1_09556 [Kordia algicida OT-1]|uniref:Uncharacterized protein n=1 Tax=Kordia algicida OT-1 TaxID=391587 RepID=A9E427_9FLAO|nr:hypothetical protein KAOT1_09556 [Kordia algicida OT-1]